MYLVLVCTSASRVDAASLSLELGGQGLFGVILLVIGFRSNPTGHLVCLARPASHLELVLSLGCFCRLLSTCWRFSCCTLGPVFLWSHPPPWSTVLVLPWCSPAWVTWRALLSWEHFSLLHGCMVRNWAYIPKPSLLPTFRSSAPKKVCELFHQVQLIASLAAWPF